MSCIRMLTKIYTESQHLEQALNLPDRQFGGGHETLSSEIEKMMIRYFGIIIYQRYINYRNIDFTQTN